MSGEPAYVAVDAMVALLIISVSMILGLQAAQTAQKAAAAANEYRRAEVVLSYLLDFGPRSFSPANGDVDGFAWNLVTQTTGVDRPIAVCRRALTITADASGRAFQASTLEVCPADPSA